MKISAFGHCWVLRWPWVLAVLAVAAVPAGLSDVEAASLPEMASARATQASLPDWMMMPRSMSSTEAEP